MKKHTNVVHLEEQLAASVEAAREEAEHKALRPFSPALGYQQEHAAPLSALLVAALAPTASQPEDVAPELLVGLADDLALLWHAVESGELVARRLSSTLHRLEERARAGAELARRLTAAAKGGAK